MIFHPRRLILLASLALLTTCNIYRPLDSAKSEEANLEEGLRCYHEKDYDCAVAAYEKLPEGNSRSERLCAAYLGQAGLTLDLLLNKVNKSGSNMLGDVATALIPWTTTRGQAAEQGAAQCLVYAQANPNSTTTLLSAVAQIIDCATRMAASDQLGNGGDSCTEPHLVVTAGKVTDGDIDSMCDEYAVKCADAIAEITSGQLSNAGLSALKQALDQFPDALKNSTSGAAAVRTALKEVVGDS